MADLKISQLTAITTLTPATDVLPVVDVTGTTKKITTNQILGAGGTATLASATISGDLTVDTNVLKVVSASDTVGIRTATPNDVLEVVGSGANGLRISRSGLPGQYTTFSAGATGQTIDAAAVIGVITFGIGGSEQMRLNSAGNVGVGVTPKSWLSSYKAIQLGYSTSLSSTTGTDFAGLSSNAYVDSVDSRWERIVSGYATQYYQNAGDGQHIWRIAGTAAADTAITWTNAMTLAANGQLLLGTSSTSGAVDIGMVMNKPSASGFVGTVYRLDNVDKAYTYIASAASALRIDTVAGYTVNVISGGTNGVYLGNGGTSWLSLSDERFKDIIEPISNAVAKVGSLRSVIGKFKTDSEGTRRSFLFAQDVQAVLPEAVDATKPEQLGLSYTEVIPLLVAAIKELSAEVNALKNA